MAAIKIISFLALISAGCTSSLSLNIPELASSSPAPSPSSSPLPCDKYVSTMGSDSNDGSIDTPWRTLQHAFDTGSAVPGDAVCVRAGIYAGGIVRQDGTAESPITLRPYNGEDVIVDGNLNVPQYKANTIYFYDASCDRYDPSYVVPCKASHWVIDGLEILGSDDEAGGAYYAVKIDQPNVTLRNNNIHRSIYDLVKAVKTADNLVIENNEIHDSGITGQANCQGIDMVGGDHLLVTRNHIYSINSIGAYAKGNARGAIFEQNLIENVYERGIMLGQSTDSTSLIDGDYECYDCIARNNIIVSTQGSCIGISSSKNSKVFNNTCFMTASRSQAAIYLSRESEIQTRNCGVDIRNNIIHQAARAAGVTSTLYMVKVGSYGLHNGSVVGADDNSCSSGFSGLTMNNNIYVAEDGSSLSVKFQWADIGLYQAAGYSFDVWKSTTGLDANSSIIDPLFTAPTTGDFRLRLGSPAIDAGAILPDVASDYLSHARPAGNSTDIGALEF